MASTPFAAIVVMGVSGCGKSTVASTLARKLRWEFAEADTFHSSANIAKMRAGIALTDEDRWPWLDAIAGWIEKQRAANQPCVVACSALRRAYRERLARGHRDVRFAYLQGDYQTIAARMGARTGHYMPPSLLASQFQTLEEPAAEEQAIVLSIERPAAELVEAIAAALDKGMAAS